jgi:DHA1 family multidrug resistance protein-like MFS transporter
MNDIERGKSETSPEGDVISNVNSRPTLPPLRPTITSQSAKEAAKALSSFETSPQNPHNWPNSRKWKIALTVALTGFISTSGSSIAVPGFHEILEEFKVDNAKVGVLVTSIYVLGMGYVLCSVAGAVQLIRQHGTIHLCSYV